MVQRSVWLILVVAIAGGCGKSEDRSSPAPTPATTPPREAPPAPPLPPPTSTVDAGAAPSPEQDQELRVRALEKALADAKDAAAKAEQAFDAAMRQRGTDLRTLKQRFDLEAAKAIEARRELEEKLSVAQDKLRAMMKTIGAKLRPAPDAPKHSGDPCEGGE